MVGQGKPDNHIGLRLDHETRSRFINRAHQYGGKTAVLRALILAWLDGRVTLTKPKQVEVQTGEQK